MSSPEPGWYPDPIDGAQRRWWDGGAWTAATSAPAPTPEAAETIGNATPVPVPPSKEGDDLSGPVRWGRQLGFAVGLILAIAVAVAGTLHLRSAPGDGQPTPSMANDTGASETESDDIAPVPAPTDPEPEPTAPADTGEASGDREPVAPSPDDPGSYVSRAGNPAPLHPDCLGMMSLCLGDDLALAVTRLGEPRESLAGDDGLGDHRWEVEGVTVSVLTDLPGAIVSIGVQVGDGAEVGAPDGVVVGRTSTSELIEGHGARVSEVWGEEGVTILELTTDIRPASGGHRSGSAAVRWDEPLADQLLGASDDLGRAGIIGRDLPVTRWTIATGSRAELGDASRAANSTPGALPRGRDGEAPPWAHEAVETAREGYEIWNDHSWNPDATLNVVVGGMKGAATGRGVHAFFFVHGEGYIGTDLWAPSNAVQVVAAEDSMITLAYTLYHADDPGCCPTAGTATVRFRWNGEKLEPLDPIPPLWTEGSPHR